ncbi:MAG: hypothetical protein ACJA2T_000993 [Gammaproteobacteria bacterium]|jgi:hypothetical protein
MKVTLPLSLILLCLISFNSTAQQECNTTDGFIQTAPDSRFTINGDGTVTDKQTGLMWARCREGFKGAGCTEQTYALTTFEWSQAIGFESATSDTVQRSDWRLPNVKELQSLVERSCSYPTINASVFPNTGNLSFWSASPDANNTSSSLVWCVDFDDGIVTTYERFDIHARRGVRLVRGGQ